MESGDRRPRTSAAHLWGRWETQVFSDRLYPYPLQNVEVLVEVEAPSGARRQARAFWDGDRTWRVRVCPDEVGVWTYRTVCSNTGDSGLHDQRGSFTCEPYMGTNPLYQHGQIRVTASGRHLEHSDGTPFFFLADTCWSGPHLADREEWDCYLTDRRQKRFSAVLFTAPHMRALSANADGRMAFAGRGQIRIDPTFFQRLDASIDAINAHGLLAVPLLLHGGIDTELNVAHFLPEDQVVLLTHYMIARYDAHHVLWDFLAEADLHSGHQRSKWERIGRAVFNDERHHPVTLHPYGMDWALDSFADEPWLDIAGYQSAHNDNEASLRWIPEGPPSTAWRLRPHRPFINLEPPYEGWRASHSGQPFDAATVRRHIYWSLLVSPVAGVGYGCQGVWAWNDGSGVPWMHPESGYAPAWQDALHAPGATSMQHLAELMAGLPWWTLRPAPDLLAVQPGWEEPAHAVVAARTEDGRQAVVYIPRGSQATLRVAADAARPTQAEWFDPRTGERQAPVVPNEGEIWPVEAPDEQDWVLLLEFEGVSTAS